MFARYNAGSPNARWQSLAKRSALESNSHTGAELLQFPPVRRISRPVDRSRSQMCVGPSWADSNAIHFPFGETTAEGLSASAAMAIGVDRRLDGSNSIMVEFRLATSSKSTDTPSRASLG